MFVTLNPVSSDAEGIIEDVVMLGAPVPASSVEWKKFSRIVAGTIVNGYCRYILLVSLSNR